MTHNTLSRSFDRVPMWIVQTIVGILLTSLIAWTTWASVTSWQHETRITVTEQKIDEVKDDIKEIKDGQKEIIHKLDRINERRGR
jgi:hypothetical protein